MERLTWKQTFGGPGHVGEIWELHEGPQPLVVVVTMRDDMVHQVRCHACCEKLLEKMIKRIMSSEIPEEGRLVKLRIRRLMAQSQKARVAYDCVSRLVFNSQIPLPRVIAQTFPVVEDFKGQRYMWVKVAIPND